MLAFRLAPRAANAAAATSAAPLLLVGSVRVGSVVAPPRRLLHCPPLLRGDVSDAGRLSARVAGPTRTEQMMSKRIMDRRNEEEARALPPSFASEEAFQAQVQASFERLARGLADMLEANSSGSSKMSLLPDPSTHSLEVSLGDKGSFMFSSDGPAQRLSMFTPRSAETHRYRWDREEQRWVADSDNHAMEELFVRDIIDTGMLSFPQL